MKTSFVNDSELRDSVTKAKKELTPKAHEIWKHVASSDLMTGESQELIASSVAIILFTLREEYTTEFISLQGCYDLVNDLYGTNANYYGGVK